MDVLGSCYYQFVVASAKGVFLIISVDVSLYLLICLFLGTVGFVGKV